MNTIYLIETLALTTDAGRHNLMLILQHLLERNPDQTLAEAIEKSILWLRKDERANFEGG